MINTMMILIAWIALTMICNNVVMSADSSLVSGVVFTVMFAYNAFVIYYLLT